MQAEINAPDVQCAARAAESVPGGGELPSTATARFAPAPTKPAPPLTKLFMFDEFR